ncbi:exonuclease [Natronoglomus mannanivorans]|uniref:Exonuclease n=1 Tax=Natronoglomus mannanivorans TaxID=2979990 RepID=A0AAP2YYU4_9EURY|nr:exonuclease [Halobacteria archaeon AArc-xg1-1]
MSTTGRPADVESTAAAIESADFVRVIARADGDSLAASGVLARALDGRAIPFQVSVAPTIGDRTTRATDGDDLTIVVGASDASTDQVRQLEASDRPASLLACDLVGELADADSDADADTDEGKGDDESERTAGSGSGPEPDPVLALAGAFAAGVEPGAGETEWLLESAIDRGLLARRPGVAVPTDDLADGLAYTTQCRGPWSGDLEVTREILAELGISDSQADAHSDAESTITDDDHRRLGSVVALDVVGDEDVSTRGATAIARLLRPYETSAERFATVGGYADVLEATARHAPGLGVALAMGHDVHESALDAWREHGRRAHAALDGASTGRYDGLFVVGVDDGPVETVARLAAAFRSPEPLVLAIGDGEAAVATIDARPLEGALEAVARDLSLGADYDVGRRRGYVRFDSNDVDDATIISAVRETL